MRIRKTSLFLGVIIITDLLVLLIYFAFSRTITNDSLENGINSIDSIAFTINDIDNFDFSFLKGSRFKGVSLFKKTSIKNWLAYEMIYSDSSIYQLKCGRKFNVNDFDNTKKSAIIGEELHDMFINDNMISIDDKNYEIIGEYSFRRKAAYSIFFTNADISSVKCDTVFIIDGLSSKNINCIYDIIKNEVKNKKGTIKLYSNENGSLLDAFEYSKMLYYTIIMMLCIYFIFVNCVTCLWIKLNKSFVTINWLIGNDKVYMVAVKGVLLNFLSHLASLLIFAFKYNEIPLALIFVFFIALIIVTGIALLYCYKMRKQLIYNFRGMII